MLSHADSLDAAFGYYRALPLRVPAFMRAPIPVPTTLIIGADDPLLTREQCEPARRFFPQGFAIEVLPGGHFVHREQPVQFAALVGRTLGRIT